MGIQPASDFELSLGKRQDEYTQRKHSGSVESWPRFYKLRGNKYERGDMPNQPKRPATASPTFNFSLKESRNVPLLGVPLLDIPHLNIPHLDVPRPSTTSPSSITLQLSNRSSSGPGPFPFENSQLVGLRNDMRKLKERQNLAIGLQMNNRFNRANLSRKRQDLHTWVSELIAYSSESIINRDSTGDDIGIGETNLVGLASHTDAQELLHKIETVHLESGPLEDECDRKELELGDTYIQIMNLIDRINKRLQLLSGENVSEVGNATTVTSGEGSLDTSDSDIASEPTRMLLDDLEHVHEPEDAEMETQDPNNDAVLVSDLDSISDRQMGFISDAGFALGSGIMRRPNSRRHGRVIKNDLRHIGVWMQEVQEDDNGNIDLPKYIYPEIVSLSEMRPSEQNEKQKMPEITMNRYMMQQLLANEFEYIQYKRAIETALPQNETLPLSVWKDIALTIWNKTDHTTPSHSLEC